MATASSSRGRREEIEIMNAFEEIEPSSLSCSTLPKASYDVFINHRGMDAKHTIASCIYHTLDLVGVRAFLDKEELELGEFIPTEIEDAMRSASIYIAIFSKHYAQSPWCLAELSFMLKTGTPIIPVFYHVQPSDLRWVTEGKGIYAVAFSKHQKNCRYNSERIEEWKMALHNVSFRSGCELKDNDDEGMLLKKIVNRVLEGMNKVPLEVAKHPVGLDAVVRDFETALESVKGNQHVQIVGIVGMGGSGKTTLAKKLYNQKCSEMEYRSSFILDVRDAAARNPLHNLQKKLLENLFGLRNLQFDNTSQGKIILASRLKFLRVLIVLDDVDNVGQLDALLPDIGNLGHGSLIIVTTRELDVLKFPGVSSIFRMNLLSVEHAKQLFCWHAFLQPRPPEGFKDLVQKFLDACGGLPLSLTVFGEMLFRRSMEYWESKLQKISRILLTDIKQRLKVSYDSLDKEEQNIFLDIACFFVGEKKSLAIAVWDGARWSGLQGLETLENKCLVEVDLQDRIRMNDHLCNLGREIASESSPYRLWLAEHITHIIRNTETKTLIRGIMAATTQFSVCSAYDGFPSCSSHYQPPFEECMDLIEISNRGLKRLRLSLLLELLVVTENYFTSEFSELSRDLVWLRWFYFKHSNLPSWISLKKLRVLELFGALSLQKLWDDNAEPPLELRELTITATCGNSLNMFPSSISCLKHLKKLVLISNCGDEFRFREMPDEFCDLQSLEHLELRYCRALLMLPTRFGELTKLRHMDLNSCEDLKILPDSFKQLVNLQFLDLSGCRLLTISSDILENMTKLEKLYFTGCRKLEKLPCQITFQASLRELHLLDTRLRELPSNLDQLSRLETLKIGSPLLKYLPESLNYLPCLTHLFINGCINLKSISYCPNLNSLGLRQLEHLCIVSSGVSLLPVLSSCQLTNLQTLKISDCPIRELYLGPESSSSMVKLKVINLSETLVTKISISEECCPSLEIVQLGQNDCLEEIETLPTTVKTLELYECTRLRSIKDLRDLVQLKSLVITGCPELDELSSLTNLSCIVRWGE